jgi:hypothetical protein
MIANGKRIPNKKRRHNNSDTEMVANETAIKYFKGGGWRVGSAGCC